LHLYEPGQIDRRWLAVAESTPGVTAARPFWITIHNWRTLPNQQQSTDPNFESQYLPIAVMAFDPSEMVFDHSQIEAQAKQLLNDHNILLDDSTQSNYGPWEHNRFSTVDVQRQRATEVGGNEFTIRGLFSLGTGLAANGALITSHRGFGRITPWDIEEITSLGLVEVEGSPENVPKVLQSLKSRLNLSLSPQTALATEPPLTSVGKFQQWFGSPPNEEETGVVSILTREEALSREKFRWLWQTPIGLIFQLGVLLSLLVGAAIVYMVLSTDVANRLPEYATLLAMGYSRFYLAGIVMTQAIVLNAFGFLAAWGCAEILYRITYSFSGIPLSMNLLRVGLVAVLGLLMCCVSGLLALRKLWKAEPASLF
jgi:putative ABC transport system permease protein